MREAHNCGERHTVSLWYCEGCEVVHMTAGGFRLSFNREEFEAFMGMTVDLYCTGFPADSIPNLGAVDLNARTVASASLH